MRHSNPLARRFVASIHAGIAASLLVAAGGRAAAHSWVRSAGGPGLERAVAIVQTPDRGYAVAATTSTAGSGLDVTVLRLDRCGAIDWQKKYGTADNEEVFDLAAIDDGGYLFAGSIESGTDLDFWIVRLQPDGTLAWQKSIGGPGDDVARAVSPTADGGFAIAGETADPSSGGIDAWVVRLDGLGGTVWQIVYGGSETDSARAIQEAPDGGLLVAGLSDSFGASFFDGWALKLDAAGAIQWQRTYGGESDDGFHSAAALPGGGFVLAGFTDSAGAGLFDVWATRIDALGSVLWQKTYGGVDDEEAFSVRPALDGGSLVGGQTLSHGAGTADLWLLRLSASGDASWQKRYGGSGNESALAVRPTTDGGWIAAGSTDSPGAAGEDLWLLKLERDGTVRPSCGLGTNTSWSGEEFPGQEDPSNATAVPSSHSAATTTALASGATLAAAVQCQPTADEVSPPGAAQPLVFADAVTLFWEELAASCSQTFNLYRGERSGTGAGIDVSCLDSGLTTSSAIDSEEPLTDTLWLYLVTGVAGGVEGSAGLDSSGVERLLSAPCP